MSRAGSARMHRIDGLIARRRRKKNKHQLPSNASRVTHMRNAKWHSIDPKQMLSPLLNQSTTHSSSVSFSSAGYSGVVAIYAKNSGSRSLDRSPLFQWISTLGRKQGLRTQVFRKQHEISIARSRCSGTLLDDIGADCIGFRYHCVVMFVFCSMPFPQQ